MFQILNFLPHKNLLKILTTILYGRFYNKILVLQEKTPRCKSISQLLQSYPECERKPGLEARS